MPALREFTRTEPRPLPVIVLADVSFSMSAILGGTFERSGQTVTKDGQTWELVHGGTMRIDVLNQCVREMISSFAQAEDLGAKIHLCIITFGGEARVHTPLQPVENIIWKDMQAEGETPMGRAMELAAELIEDRGKIPGRAFAPTVLLASDGRPTDGWQAGLHRLTREGRAKKADRMALAIGKDCDEAMLGDFLGDPGKHVFHADDVGQIREFFRVVTMSVTTRSQGGNPERAE